MNNLRTQSIILLILLFQVLSAKEYHPFAIDYEQPAEERICFALYTVHENIVKLTAQFYPIKNYDPFEAVLQIKEGDTWIDRDTARIIYPGYTALFRIENWDDTREVEYRVAYNNIAFYEGIIKKNPIDKEEFVMGVFSCNSIYAVHGGDASRQDIVENMKKIKPDLLFFAGDQVYDHSEHYLHWLNFGRDFGEILRNTPSITIPDDHDVGQANLWGSGGKKAKWRSGEYGGYYLPVEYVKEVERVQTSHLPDPYDPTPIGLGIGVYYTDLKWGGMSFAILEDRKFKTGPKEVFGEYAEIIDSIFTNKINPKVLDVPGTNLLGDRQLDFLEDWTTDWENAEMKATLSATIFCMASHFSGKHNWPIGVDFDANGWPQTGRNKALRVIRKSYSPMIAGDQHLATVIQQGIDDWGDAGYSFATPAIASLWMRWWEPPQPGLNRLPGAPEYTGEFYDGFNNKITMMAAANPTAHLEDHGQSLVNSRGAGIGVVRFNKNERTITFECYPRNVDITKTENNFEGWPISISQMDNFNIKDGFELPNLHISKPNQVVTIVNDKTQEVESSVRIKGIEYQPKVVDEGNYTILVGEGDSQQKQVGIKAKKLNAKTLDL